jgi:hypothetical protein
MLVPAGEYCRFKLARISPSEMQAKRARRALRSVGHTVNCGILD